MSKEIKIGRHRLTQEGPDCFVIAEVGHNHGGDIDVCKQMFQAAAYGLQIMRHMVVDLPLIVVIQESLGVHRAQRARG